MQLILEDARRALARMDDASVDLIVSDVPYRTISGGNKNPAAPSGMLHANDGRIFKHNHIDVSEYAGELYRVLRPGSHCYIFTNEKERNKTESAMKAVGFKSHGLLIWKKNNATPNRWYMKNFEQIILFHNDPLRTINNAGTKACLDVDNPVGRKWHPTEKPVELLRTFIENSSNPGDVILDPFMGSGSTGVACAECDRDFIGIEIDPEYFGVACKRMNRMPGS